MKSKCGGKFGNYVYNCLTANAPESQTLKNKGDTLCSTCRKIHPSGERLIKKGEDLSFSKVCIIDDDPIYVFTASKTLRSLALCEEILVYTDGKEAFTGLSQLIAENGQLPDIILLDINMPVWDGWDFLNEFSKVKAGRKIPIFIVSSSDHPDDLDRAGKNEAVRSVITKPLTKEMLQRVFRESNPEESTSL
jgi:CheY-like chemotaxis protein